MRVRILGSAAGGGAPQWNCGCAQCQALRAGSPGILPRTQDSIALSADRQRWILCNASPDIHRQIHDNPPLHPRGPRHTPISAIVLSNGDMDHILGLFSLRESTALVVYATAEVQRGLLASPMIRTLQRFEGQLTLRTLHPGEKTLLTDGQGQSLGITLWPQAMPGKPPVHLVGMHPPGAGDNVALWFAPEGQDRPTVAYIPAAAGVADLVSRLKGLELVLLDGTFWSSTELIALKLGTARAEDMAHLPIGGPEGSLAQLQGVDVRRKFFTHINNTNPILREGSAERIQLENAGWAVAHDGLEVVV